MIYRQAEKSDVPSMALVRALHSGTAENWRTRITRYMDGEHHPQHALMPRMLYVALDRDILTGLIAGHLTRRYQCDGELQWIDVILEYRGTEVGATLLHHLAKWFAGQNAARICVNVDPANTRARRFYTRHGARDLNEHWLVWEEIHVVLGLEPKA